MPSLVHDYAHTRLDRVAVGPRREVTLDACVLSWAGSRGRYGPAVRVRFGAVNNLDAVAAFFGSPDVVRSELAYLRYAADRPSKPGRLFIDVEWERVDGRVRISCGNITESSPDR